MEWNSTLYNDKHDFVAEYGKGLLEYIPDNKEQTILDLGCGTGILTAQLNHFGSRVVGVDGSQSMIDKAKEQFPYMEFRVCDALNLPFEQEWDIVFSNAVFHWIDDHNSLLSNIYNALKPKGLLICEFGAAGNIATIEKAFKEACKELGYPYQSKFRFPTAEDFSQSLNHNGFIIDKIYEYDRATTLEDAEQGLANWMTQFYAAELSEMPDNIQDAAIQKVENLTRDTLWNGTEWVADYRRLRAIAHI